MKRLLLFLLSVFVLPVLAAAGPNIVLIFCDDLGYGDLSCYGSTKNRTPAIDQIAKEGMRFTHFYSSSPVCTPSRSSLMTGCYAQRVGMHEDTTEHWVLIPRSKRGLHPEEITMAEALKARGYATACIGKWHLGDQPQHLPTRHGFDRYYGIPYSNDMQSAGRGDPPLPILDQERVIEAPADQATLTERYTDEAIQFIESNRAQPFFLYLPHTFPHLPLFATKPFLNRSQNGKYGATIEEIDASTRRILDALDRLDIADDTLILFTSDNGSNGRNGGSNAPLSGHKGQTMEGGMRIPMVARWPGVIPMASQCDELSTTMDLFPTFLGFVEGAPYRSQRVMDGKDIGALFRGEEGAKTPHEVFFYYRRHQLQAVRSGAWKYHLPLERSFPAWDRYSKQGPGRGGKLVNLVRDQKEEHDVSGDNPGIVRKLVGLAAEARSRLGHEGTKGSEQRSAFDVENPTPRVLE
jgi:arylsulfatase A